VQLHGGFRHNAKWVASDLRREIGELMHGFSPDSEDLFTNQIHLFARSHLMCNLREEPEGKSKCDGDYRWRGKALPRPIDFLVGLKSFQQFRRMQPADPREGHTFFASEAIRAALLPSRRAPAAARLIAKAIAPVVARDAGWTGELAGDGKHPRVILVLTDWLAEVVVRTETHLDHNGFFGMLHELHCFLCLNDTGKAELQLVAVQFLHKFTGLGADVCVHLCAGAYTISQFNFSYDSIVQFVPGDSSVFDLLYRCVGTVPDATRKVLVARYREVMDRLATMHADPEAYLTSPAQRAALVASEFVGGNLSRAPYAPTGPEDNLLRVVRQTENAQPLFF